MTRLHYISPSLLPSRSANSVHVMHQCDGFARAGIDISLYAKRAITNADDLPEALRKNYGVNVENWNLRTFQSDFSRADTLRIALMALKPVLLAPRGELVLSRNLYAALILASARKKMLFETHQLEYGARKIMQYWIMTRPWVRTVAISDSLVSCLEEHHAMRLRDPLVLHDAAPDGIQRLAPERRRQELAGLLKTTVDELAAWNVICGYFGQLYAGRGIEIIESMAAARPACLFLVFGGSESDVAARCAIAPTNLRFMGHVSHPESQSAQAAVDVLLMPYQRSVSIGIQGHDTARWMSPMKMFEYLAAGVPIISSDLPVLREVLTNGRNALLVNAENADQWLAALDSLISNPDYANSMGELAHREYQTKHTWLRRAESLLAAGRDL
jgi:hypothetical protein